MVTARYGNCHFKIFAVYPLSEINFGVVVAALQKLFHLFDGDLSEVGAGAGVCYGVLGDLGRSLKENVLENEAVFAGIAVKTAVFDALRMALAAP